MLSWRCDVMKVCWNELEIKSDSTDKSNKNNENDNVDGGRCQKSTMLSKRQRKNDLWKKFSGEIFLLNYALTIIRRKMTATAANLIYWFFLARFVSFGLYFAFSFPLPTDAPEVRLYGYSCQTGLLVQLPLRCICCYSDAKYILPSIHLIFMNFVQCSLYPELHWTVRPFHFIRSLCW